MQRFSFLAFALVVVGISGVVLPSRACSQELATARVAPWTVSNVKGSPDPPLPYKATRVFQNIALDRPTDVSWVASANRWLATQHLGKLVTFENDPEGAVVEPFLDLSEALGHRVFNAYAVLYHPDLQKQPWCFVTYVAKPQDPQGLKLGRFKVTNPSTGELDPSSLQVLLSWSSAGHAGGTMRFGPDGMLYFGVGDGQRPYPPDASNT
ncbi:MAG: sorbosone dehydrogenase family protein, partial [Rubripirellula sp.]